ncbi:MAG: phage BR0599 family protein [Rubrivivax sp.]
MTYTARETSMHAGAPVELYAFAIGSVTWRYTSSARTVTVDGVDWTPAPLKRGRIETSQETARNGLDIECARDFPVAQLLAVSPPSDPIALTIRRVHRGDGETAVIWIGQILNCDFSPREGKATLHGECARSVLRRVGLRRAYQRLCPHPLFGKKCGLARAAHAIATTVTSVSGLDVGVAALLARPYSGGWIEWTRPSGFVDRRFVQAVTGLQLRLTLPIYGLPVGAAVTVLPGCDHTTSTCATVYANLDNHGGFPSIPSKNPFGSAPVY